ANICKHCDKCGQCVKSTYKHCSLCDRCHLPQRCPEIHGDDCRNSRMFLGAALRKSEKAKEK
ncbi:hypothetical protein WUBG_17109, partial [Wuchereria bancrofti]